MKGVIPGCSPRGGGDYTPEEHLTAAVMEYKRLEAANQNSVERMYSVLSSPFKIGNKPCETLRGDALRCLFEVAGTSVVIGADDTKGRGADTGSGLLAKQEFPPVHRCYENVLSYESCVLENSLARHNSMVASFEARRLREADSFHMVRPPVGGV